MKIKLSILFFLLSFSLFAQMRRQYLKAAEEAYSKKNYYAALKYYEEALDFDFTQTAVWFEYGKAAEKFSAFTLAEEAYEYVLEQDSLNKFPQTNYRMAGVKKQLGKYSEAIDFYQRMLKNTKAYTPAQIADAKCELQSCEWAEEVISNPDTNIEIVNMGKGMNTPFSDFAAERLGSDIYYTSFSFQLESDDHDPPREYNKVLISRNGGEGELWGNINSTSRHTAHSAFSTDNQRVYFTYCDYVAGAIIRCELYYREKDSLDMWGKPVKLPGYINKPNFTASEPNIGKDTATGNDILYFASDRDEGKGGMDIWYVEVKEDGTFGDPVNLEAINTTGNDITPFFHTPTQTLYFSNDTRQGLGGHDIFKSARKADGSWSEPIHLGYPINSSYDDIHFKLSPGKASALFSSNRLGSIYIIKEKEACCHDIYTMQTRRMELMALTFDDWTKKALPGATVTLEKLSGSGEPQSKTNPQDNTFEFTPQRKEKYLITATRPGYRPYTDTIHLDRMPLLDELSFTKEIYMEPAEVDLDVFTYDDYTKQGLVGTKVQIFELDNGVPKLVAEKENENGNDFSFKINMEKTYVIKGTKQGYESALDTIYVAGSDIVENRRIERKLYLRPLIFAEFLPIILYFDNDQPDPGSLAATSDKEYLELWKAYYDRKAFFIEQFTEGMNEQMKFLAEQRLEDFFEREVKSSGEAFGVFSDLLFEFLRQGNDLEIALRGYSSPRASSQYNKILSKRRIASVRNHFENYRDGIFKPFLDAGTLTIIERPYGESRAKADVSDKLNDLRNSIFGVPASLERRVEIIDVKEADDIDEALDVHERFRTQ